MIYAESEFRTKVAALGHATAIQLESDEEFVPRRLRVGPLQCQPIFGAHLALDAADHHDALHCLFGHSAAVGPLLPHR